MGTTTATAATGTGKCRLNPPRAADRAAYRIVGGNERLPFAYAERLGDRVRYGAESWCASPRAPSG